MNYFPLYNFLLALLLALALAEARKPFTHWKRDAAPTPTPAPIATHASSLSSDAAQITTPR